MRSDFAWMRSTASWVWFVLVVSTAASGAQSLGEWEAVGYALEHSPDLLEARARVETAQAQLSQASTLLRTNPEASVAAGPRWGSGLPKTGLDLEVAVDQRVEIFGQQGLRRKSAERLLEAARGDLRTAEGRAAIEAFMAAFCADELNGPPKVLYGEGHSFSDVAKKVVSIINLASIAAVETAVGRPVDPLRFRANLYVTGWPAWREFELMGQEIDAGGARLKVVKRIVRCAATNVDPLTGVRDMTIPQTLMQTFDHMDCGVYAEVVTGGEIAVGDTVRDGRLL